MINMLMTEEQVYKIKERTLWDDELQKWNIPAFIVKSREMQLPKLNNVK